MTMPFATVEKIRKDLTSYFEASYEMDDEESEKLLRRKFKDLRKILERVAGIEGYPTLDEAREAGVGEAIESLFERIPPVKLVAQVLKNTVVALGLRE